MYVGRGCSSTAAVREHKRAREAPLGAVVEQASYLAAYLGQLLGLTTRGTLSAGGEPVNGARQDGKSSMHLTGLERCLGPSTLSAGGGRFALCPLVIVGSGLASSDSQSGSTLLCSHGQKRLDVLGAEDSGGWGCPAWDFARRS